LLEDYRASGFAIDPNAPLGQLGVIGNQKTCALVLKNGDVPYLCWPRLDSPPVFSAILSGQLHNAFGLRFTSKPDEIDQHYEADCNILVTILHFADCILTLRDCMVIGGANAFIREVTLKGEKRDVEAVFNPAYDYEPTHTLQADQIDENCVRFRASNPLHVTATVPMHALTGGCSAHFEVQEGDTHYLAMGDRIDNLSKNGPAAFDQARRFWQDYIADGDFNNDHASHLKRAALVFGLLHNREFGSVAAAATFGLPEAIGGERNWDYRFTWVRDTGITANAAIRMKLLKPAQEWLDFHLDLTDADDPCPLLLMRGLDASKLDEEKELDIFSGYRGSKPVRIGNGAAEQLQLDIYGQIIDSYRRLQIAGVKLSDGQLSKLRVILDWLLDNWCRTDTSIWEIRADSVHYLYSRLMSWLAFKQGRALFESSSQAVNPLWQEEQQKINDDIIEKFWCEDLGTFRQSSELNMVDAAVIALRINGFLQKNDSKWEATKGAVRKRLLRKTGVLRYPHEADDGFESDEGTFVMCTCWWIEALALDGELDEAREMLGKVLARFSKTGIMTEEIREDGTLLGNLPQAFSHAGIVNAILAISEAEATSGS